MARATSGEGGKGQDPRPCATGREERDLRYALAFGKISFDEYERRYKKLKKQGKIIRKF